MVSEWAGSKFGIVVKLKEGPMHYSWPSTLSNSAFAKLKKWLEIIKMLQKLKKKKIILANQLNFFLLGHSVVSYGCDLGQKMASGCNRGLFRTKKWPKKDQKMNPSKHTSKLKKNNELFSS